MTLRSCGAAGVRGYRTRCRTAERGRARACCACCAARAQPDAGLSSVRSGRRSSRATPAERKRKRKRQGRRAGSSAPSRLRRVVDDEVAFCAKALLASHRSGVSSACYVSLRRGRSSSGRLPPHAPLPSTLSRPSSAAPCSRKPWSRTRTHAIQVAHRVVGRGGEGGVDVEELRCCLSAKSQSHSFPLLRSLVRPARQRTALRAPLERAECKRGTHQCVPALPPEFLP